MPPPGGTRCGLDYFVSPQPSSLFLARPPYKSPLSCFSSFHVSSPFPLVLPPQQQQLHFIHSSLFVTWKGVSNNELLTYHPLRPPPCSSCLSTMVAAAGRRSSFPSSPTSHHSFLAPSVFDKVKSAWTAFFSKFGFGKGKKDKDEATLLPASPRISESFLSFVSSLAPYPVSTRVSCCPCLTDPAYHKVQVQQPTIDSRVSYPSSEVPVLDPIQVSPNSSLTLLPLTQSDTDP